MQIKLKTDFFSYVPCELTLSGGSLFLHFGDTDKIISVVEIRSLTVKKERDGTYRLEMIVGDETLEALVTRENGRKLSELLNAIASKHREIEFRMTGEYE